MSGHRKSSSSGVVVRSSNVPSSSSYALPSSGNRRTPIGSYYATPAPVSPEADRSSLALLGRTAQHAECSSRSSLSRQLHSNQTTMDSDVSDDQQSQPQPMANPRLASSQRRRQQQREQRPTLTGAASLDSGAAVVVVADKRRSLASKSSTQQLPTDVPPAVTMPPAGLEANAAAGAPTTVDADKANNATTDAASADAAAAAAPPAHGRFRSAVPCMHISVAALCCLMNFVGPGTGTLLAATCLLCGAECEMESKRRAFLWNLAAGLLQLVTAPLIVGWIWSALWGVCFVNLARKWWIPRLADRDRSFSRLSSKISRL